MKRIIEVEKYACDMSRVKMGFLHNNKIVETIFVDDYNLDHWFVFEYNSDIECDYYKIIHKDSVEVCTSNDDLSEYGFVYVKPYWIKEV